MSHVYVVQIKNLKNVAGDNMNSEDFTPLTNLQLKTLDLMIEVQVLRSLLVKHNILSKEEIDETTNLLTKEFTSKILELTNSELK